MSHLLLACILSGTNPTVTGAGGAKLIHLQDDIPLEFGGTKGVADCWIEWDTAGTDGLLIQCTDVDGVGTDGPLVKCNAGTDDCTWTGDLTMANATLAAAGTLKWSTRGQLAASADGVAVLSDAAVTNSMTFDAPNSRWLPDSADTDSYWDSTGSDRFDLVLGGETMAQFFEAGTDRIIWYVGQVWKAAADQSLNAGDTIAHVTGSYLRVQGNGGAVTLTSTPSITTTSVDDAKIVILQGISSTNLLTIQDERNLPSSALRLEGGVNSTLGQGDMLGLMHDSGDGLFYELFRTNVSGHNGKGAFTNSRIKPETLTFQGGGGDASKTTTGSIFVDGGHVTHVTGRVKTAGTTCTSMDIGDGVDVDLFGDNIAVTDTTTFDASDATANWSNPQLADGEITITGVGGNCVDLVVDLYVHYLEGVAATSD
jgi:hypothetical protein